MNQTTETLQNLTIEFATLGDLKVVERPSTQNVGPHDFINIQATIKGKSFSMSVSTRMLTFAVSSTDTGVIFGNIIYEGSVIHLDKSATIANIVAVRRVLTPMSSFSMTSTSTSWTTSSPRNAQKRNSGPCGRSLSGRIRSTSTPRPRRYVIS